jgi:hypothetical protein
MTKKKEKRTRPWPSPDPVTAEDQSAIQPETAKSEGTKVPEDTSHPVQPVANGPFKAPFEAYGVTVKDADGRTVCLCATSAPWNTRTKAAGWIADALNTASSPS